MSKTNNRLALKEAIASQLSQQLFPYQHLKVNLIPETKGLQVIFLSPTGFNDFPLDMPLLGELDLLMNWLKEHQEVRYVTFCFDTDYQSFYPEQLSKRTETEITQNLLKLRLTLTKVQKLSQTTIFHMKRGLEGPMAEFAVAADLRMAYRDCELLFNHTCIGLTPLSLGLELLEYLVTPAKARDWVLTGRAVSSYELYHSGLISLFSDGVEDEKRYLTKLSENSCHARAQAKKVFYELMNRHAWNRTSEVELKCFDSGDFFEAVQARSEERATNFKDINKITKNCHLPLGVEIK